RSAEQRVNDQGGFPAQEQQPPGATGEMHPVPDHGEQSYVGQGKLHCLRALDTGGASEIGRATAIAFAREGADVAISFLETEQDDAEETARWVREAGQQAVLLPGDLTDSGWCEALVEETVAALGGLDILVNNAGYQMARSVGIEEI